MVPAGARLHVSHLVPPLEKTQIAIASLVSLTAIVAPIFMTQLFGYFAADTAPVYFPGAPFFAAGAMVLVSIVVFHRVMAAAETVAD